MTVFEIIVVLAASPIVAALIYGTWKFSSDADPEKPFNAEQKPLGRYGRLRKAFSA